MRPWMMLVMLSLLPCLAAVSCTATNVATPAPAPAATPATVAEAEPPVPAMPRLTPRPATVGGVKSPLASLSGTWRFNPAAPADMARLTAAQAATGSGWADIQVPGQWSMQGHTVAKDQAAAYLRTFDVPEDWTNQRIKLRFDAVYSDAAVYVNGREVGRHLGGFTPFEIDVTDAARPGANTLALTVRSDSVADVLASGQQYAGHPLGGITRKVTLFALPRVNIAAVVTSTTLDKNGRDAVLHVKLTVANENREEARGKGVMLTLKFGDTQAAEVMASLPAVPPGKTIEHAVDIPVPSARLWDNEHPNLYTLACCFGATSSEERVRQRVGLRQIEIQGNTLLVNGKPVKLRGACRHEVHPLRGRSLTGDQWRRDAELFRAGNVNYIRTSHYPPAEEFLDACDALGLFVECEAPLCWVNHGANPTWTKGGWNYQDPKFFQPIALANLENVAANRHHPSIILWSLANESKWSRHFARTMEAVRAADPSRPTSFHDQSWGPLTPNGSQTQVANFHYPDLNGPAKTAASPRPLLFGEYCHLNAYNRFELAADPGLRDMWGVALARMWKPMHTAPGMLGGAIWAAIDDVFQMPDGKSFGYGEWGPLDGWRRPKPEYFHMQKVYSPVRIDSGIVLFANEPINLVIENRSNFSSLAEYKIEWRAGGQSGVLALDAAPGEKTKATIHPPEPTRLFDEVDITVTDPRGFVADKYAFHLDVILRTSPGESNRAAKAPATKFAESISAPARLKETPEAFVIEAADRTWTIDRKTGQIVKGEITMPGGKREAILAGGPTLMVLPLNSTGGKQLEGSMTYPPFTAPCTNWKAESVTANTVGDDVLITVTGSYDEARGSYAMTFDRHRRLIVSYDFTVTKDVNPRQWGVVFDLPRGCDTLAWNRNAPWSAYPEDHIGRPKGTARAFGTAAAYVAPNLREEPKYPWSQDATPLGTNDFRSTKANILWASLTKAPLTPSPSPSGGEGSSSGIGLKIVSDGRQHARAWVDGDRVRLLVANYSNGGAEGFLRGQFKIDERPLKKGDTIKDTVRVEVLRR